MPDIKLGSLGEYAPVTIRRTKTIIPDNIKNALPGKLSLTPFGWFFIPPSGRIVVTIRLLLIRNGIVSIQIVTREKGKQTMQLSKVECIIKPFKLEEVKEALTRFGVSGMTIYEVKGFGRQRGHKEIYRGSEYKVDFIPKLKVEVYLGADQVDEAIDAIINSARTGEIGDGKIVVTPIESIMRIRTGEHDLNAL